MNKIGDFINSSSDDRVVHIDKCCNTILTQISEKLKQIKHRRPDILVQSNGRVDILEITVCYDLYFDVAHDGKISKYQDLVKCLRKNGFDTKLYVLCFGSLGCIRKNVWYNLKQFNNNIVEIKELLKWCSISTIIGSNYVWRHRVKQLHNEINR